MTSSLPDNRLVAPVDAQRELARREMARRHLCAFSEYVAPWYRAAAHHRLLGEYLEQVETYIRTGGRTGIGRLLIFEPPRHGKTEQASRHFPAWVIGRNPNTRVILTSYNADLAVSNSRAVRALLTNDRYQPVFGSLASVDAPVMLSQDSRSSESWDLAAPNRGGMVAAGVGGGVTGKGANLMILDDPFKNREEAESASHRDKVWDWWLSSAYTRLENGGAVIGMQTRWHGDDWAGRLLKAMATNPQAERWVVVCLPAFWEEPDLLENESFEQHQQRKLLDGVWAEEHDLMDRKPGQALWPQKYNDADLERIRANLGPYDWSALYQQTPYLREGHFFKREWFSIVDELPIEGTNPDIEATQKIVPAITQRVRYWDKASTTGGDYSVGVLMARGKNRMFYVEDVVRGRWSSHERDAQMRRTAEQDSTRPGPKAVTWHPQDPGSAGLDSAKATSAYLSPFPVHFETVTGEKTVRAEPLASQAEAGRVRLVKGGWNQAFIEELVSFPRGKYDDQVDGTSGAFSRLFNRQMDGQLFY